MGSATTSSSPLLSYTSSRSPDELQTEESLTQPSGGQPHEELPAGHLDRVWPNTGPNGIV